MNKLWLIIKREYLVRVRKKSFLLITLLTPIAMGVLIAFSAYMASEGTKTSKKVLVKDDSHIFEKYKNESEKHEFTFSNDGLENLKTSYSEKGHDILIHIPAFKDSTLQEQNVSFYSEEKLGLAVLTNIERQIEKSYKNYKIDISDIDKKVYESFDTDVNLDNGAMDSEDSTNDKTGKLTVIIGTMLGGIMGFLMYMVIFIYGGMVMRSVMEEKINRIVEVMISSVKPFQLMLGKILGVGGVGLTQLFIWMILIPLIIIGVQSYFGGSQDPQDLQQLSQQMNGMNQDLGDFDINSIVGALKDLNWFLIIPVFVIFFFGGYFIYASLFAAIGSAIGDDMGEGQQLMLPIVVPVILAFVMLQPVLADPNSTMAIFGSLFPLFSPIIMPARLAFDPPMWQVILSIVILISSSIFMAWLSGRIYRVGILMYGKKVNFRTITKWLFYKQ